MNGSSTAASSAMMASTHTISSKVKPRSAASLIFRGHAFERNVGRNPAAAFLAVGAVGHDVVGTVFAGRAVDVSVAPRIGRHAAALQIRSVPGRDAGRALYERRQSLGSRRKPAGVEIEQVERARETLQLDPGRLDLGFAEIVEHTRTDQAHDEADDGDHHQHFDQGKALLTGISSGSPPRAGDFAAGDKQSADDLERYHDEPTFSSSRRVE